MDFTELFSKISPVLKRIVYRHKTNIAYIAQDDLYQEMCVYLWTNFKNGLSPKDNKNEAYIIKGCLFHILNYLRMQRKKITIQELEEILNGEGETLKDILADNKEAIKISIERAITLQEIEENCFTEREKEVFKLLLQRYTLREIGRQLAISHVSVVKIKKNIKGKLKKEMK